MSKSMKRTENEILGQIIRDFTDNGYSAEIEDLGSIMNIHAIDTEKQEGDEDRYFGWVKFVWGNTEDCISDYTTNLEKIIKPSLDLSAHYRD